MSQLNLFIQKLTSFIKIKDIKVNVCLHKCIMLNNAIGIEIDFDNQIFDWQLNVVNLTCSCPLLFLFYYFNKSSIRIGTNNSKGHK